MYMVWYVYNKQSYKILCMYMYTKCSKYIILYLCCIVHVFICTSSFRFIFSLQDILMSVIYWGRRWPRLIWVHVVRSPWSKLRVNVWKVCQQRFQKATCLAAWYVWNGVLHFIHILNTGLVLHKTHKMRETNWSIALQDKIPPPLRIHRYGNRIRLPKATAYPTIASTNSSWEPHFSLSAGSDWSSQPEEEFERSGNGTFSIPRTKSSSCWN